LSFTYKVTIFGSISIPKINYHLVRAID